MTLVDRVLKHMRQTRGQWVLHTLIGGNVAQIRTADGCRCPIESLEGKSIAYIDLEGMGPLMCAADDCDCGIGRALRRRMLRAAGLKEGT